MSNIFSHQSFSVFSPSPSKPYPTLLHSIFPFRNKLFLIRRRSRSIARSSSDLVLISTTEHRDGSILFRFGDASEVLENDDVLEEIESKSCQESSIVKVLENDDVVEEIESESRQESTILKVLENDVVEEIESESRQENTIVKVLDGDKEREVTIKRVERGYGSDDMSITEVADGLTNADTDSGIDERYTKFTSDLSDSYEESSDILSDIYEEEVLSSQSEAKENDSLEVLLDETDSTAQLDNDESSNPSISLLDNSPNSDKSPDTDGTLVMDSDDYPSVSVNLASLQVSKVEVMDVEKAYDENESDKVKSEDTGEGDTEGLMPPASMPVSDVELIDAANEDIEEPLQDTNITEGTLIDEMPPSDLLVEPSLDEVEETMEVSSIEAVIVTDQVVEDELQEVSTNNKEENDVSYVIPISREEETELTVEEEEVSQTQSASLELEPTRKVSYTELQYTTGQYPDGGILQIKEESDDLSVSDKPETVKVSDIEAQHPEGLNFDDGILQVTDESEDPSASVEFETEILDIKLQDSMGQNPDDGILQVTDESEDPTVSVKLETIQISDIELQDTVGPNPDDGILEVTDESEDPSVSVKLGTIQNSDTELQDAIEDPSVSVKLETIRISDIELQDTVGMNPDDGILQVTDESEDPLVSVNLEIQISDIELQDTVGPNPDDGILQVTDESEDPSVPVRFETIQVSDTELVDTTGQNPDDGILQVSDEIEDPSISVELETTQVSNIEVMDVTQPYVENELGKVETEDTSEGDIKDLLPPATIHNITDVELTDAANEVMEERFQDMNISEGVLVDGMLISDSIRAEPTVDDVMQLQSSDVELEGGMEVSTTNGMDVKNWSVDDELQQVSIDNRDEIDVADVMTFQDQDSMSIELTPTMQDSDVEIQDSMSQNLDDGSLQVINEEAGDSFTMDVEQLSYKLEGQPVQDEGENRSILEQCAETNAPGISILLKQDALDTLPEAEKTEENISSSELPEASEDTALLLSAEAKVKREEIYLTGEFLSSGAACLLHPFKALTGGDDAYFVAGDKWLGVANGVSQWSFEGTDPGVYAQELMKTCEDIVLNTRSVPVTNPVELLCRGVKETNMSGSSNVLIASFDGQALHVANIGDTGFLIIRHGAIYKKSSPLLHEFHFALQVKDCDDPQQLMEECTIELEEGDIVVSATDGLFDNLYEREIAMIVLKSLKAEMKPQEIANVLATRAQEVGKSTFVRSPFSDAAQAAGYTGYSGGKPDNVAVIVSLVEKRSNVLGK